jgi:hypothetical protein
MNFDSHLAPLRRPLAVWLALLIALLGAIAPTLSYSMARAGNVPLVEICTSLGPRWVALTVLPGSPGGQESALHIEHCPFCLLHNDQVAPPPQVSLRDFGGSGEFRVPVVRQAFFYARQLTSVPPARGPPGLPCAT